MTKRTAEEAMVELKSAVVEHEVACKMLDELEDRVSAYREHYKLFAGVLEDILPDLVPSGDLRDAVQLYIEVRRNLAVL